MTSRREWKNKRNQKDDFMGKIKNHNVLCKNSVMYKNVMWAQ